jgi:hypothetical protein
MPSTFQSLVVVLLAVLPGALYTWSFEQQAGRWGATAGDRVQRFLGASAFFLVLELPMFYNFIYRPFVATGDLDAGRALPWWIWVVPMVFVLFPVAAGRYVGIAVHRRQGWANFITGPSPAPRAWDDLFATSDLTGWIRLRLKEDGAWACGLWGESVATGLQSYAAGYPEPQDLLIAELAEIDSDGEFLIDANGNPVLTGRSLLIRWSEITYAEFIPG